MRNFHSTGLRLAAGKAAPVPTVVQGSVTGKSASPGQSWLCARTAAFSSENVAVDCIMPRSRRFPRRFCSPAMPPIFMARSSCLLLLIFVNSANYEHRRSLKAGRFASGLHQPSAGACASRRHDFGTVLMSAGAADGLTSVFRFAGCGR